MNLDGVQLPARARVESSAADASGYRATVNILDGAGEPTNQIIEDLALDPLWLSAGGKGVWHPPAEGQIVAVVWMGGSAGHPVITTGALMQPAAPRKAVAAGDHSIQGDEWEALMTAGEWILSDVPGALLSAKGSRFKVAGPADDLLEILDAWLDALIAALTVPDTAGGTPLAFNAGTIAALQAIKTRLPLVLRS